MRFTVYFKPNTASDYGVRLIVNHPFLRSRPKSVGICITHSNDNKNIEKAELFVPDHLISEVPEFFIGELKALSGQITDVERA